MTQEAQSLSIEISSIVNVYKFDLSLFTFTSAFTKAMVKVIYIYKCRLLQIPDCALYPSIKKGSIVG